jgi:deoxyribonuclease V
MLKKHPWNVSVEEAYRIQKDLKKHIVLRDMVKNPETVGGVDVSYQTHGAYACCVIAVFSYPDSQFLCSSHSKRAVTFPYIPGLLTFREGPLVDEAFSLLSIIPDIFIFDGHGICHPSGIGIATHMGIILDIATIGCAKNYLTGTFTNPGSTRGDTSPLMLEDTLVGYVLRTQNAVKPVFVSPGHKTGIRSSTHICLHCSRRFRIPEPVRHAHISSRDLLRKVTV